MPKAKTKKRLTKSQMRVAIAKDVLAQMKAKKIIADTGCWVYDPKMGYMETYMDGLIDKFLDDPKNDCCEFTEFHAKDFTSKVNKCKVCALGSIFVSAANLYDNIVLDTRDPSDVFDSIKTSPLTKYFSADELLMIESSYEGQDGACFDDLNIKEAGLANAYYISFKNDKDRLAAIMKNIIRNKGYFKPDQDITKENLISSLMSYI